MKNDYSVDALKEFLSYLAEKGLMKKPTAVSRKAACNKLLAILDDADKADLRRIDINSVADRFNNLEGTNYTPKSLQVYKSRVGSALDDFFRYKENPANFSVGSSSRRTLKRNITKDQSFDKTEHTSPKYQTETKNTHNSSMDIQTLNIPISLRDNCIIQLNGIPTNLTVSEANKIANVIQAMAIDTTD